VYIGSWDEVISDESRGGEQARYLRTPGTSNLKSGTNSEAT
jgi:hypothetical protein